MSKLSGRQLKIRVAFSENLNINHPLPTDGEDFASVPAKVCGGSPYNPDSDGSVLP